MSRLVATIGDFAAQVRLFMAEVRASESAQFVRDAEEELERTTATALLHTRQLMVAQEEAAIAKVKVQRARIHANSKRFSTQGGE